MAASLATAAAAAAPPFAGAECRFARVVEFPVTVADLRPAVTARINGAEAKFLLDSGAFYSMMSSASASDFKLKLTPMAGLRVQGVGGTASAEVTTVKEFTLAGHAFRDIEFIVGGTDVGNAGLLGQNFLEKWDVEYDLARGAIRLFKADGCRKKLLAYWLTPGQEFSTMDIAGGTPMQPHTIGTVTLNGVKIRAIFDTGAAVSMLALTAAARVGVKTDSPGVSEAGYSVGIGAKPVKVYLATFDSLKIGDGEEIRNARLRIADLKIDQGEMLLGADFFLSHRLLVANSQQRLYLTYNGGPVFDLNAGRAGAPAPAPAPATTAADVAADAAAEADQPADAAGFARRAAAFASRRDFAHALADFDRACELDPASADYLYLRGMTHRRNGQGDEALRDFDAALALKPDHLQALMSRAELRLARKDVAGALADADAAERVAPRAAAVRLDLGRLYLAGERWNAAVGQFDLWIEHHREDENFPGALNSRCWARASSGTGLDKALADCNAALRLAAPASPLRSQVLDSRALVQLRAGRYAKAIADYDAALAIRSQRSAWPLYGRGIAKLRLGKTVDGRADLEAAAAISPKIGERFASIGIAP